MSNVSLLFKMHNRIKIIVDTRSIFPTFFDRGFAFHIVGYSWGKLKINKDKLLAIHWNFQKIFNIVVRIVKRKSFDEISWVNIIKMLLLTCVVESTLKSTTTRSEIMDATQIWWWFPSHMRTYVILLKTYRSSRLRSQIVSSLMKVRAKRDIWRFLSTPKYHLMCL